MLFFSRSSFNLNLFRMGILGASQGWEGEKTPRTSLNLSHIFCNDETWHSNTLLKEDPDNI